MAKIPRLHKRIHSAMKHDTQHVLLSEDRSRTGDERNWVQSKALSHLTPLCSGREAPIDKTVIVQ